MEDPPDPTDDAQGRSLYVFRIRDRWYAFPTEQVGLVLPPDLPRTRVPTAPAHIEGVVNHRGVALAVFDLPAFLGRASAREPEGDARRRLLVVRAAGYEAALWTDEVQGIVQVPAERLRPPPDALEHASALVDQDLGAVEVLDAARLLPAAAARPRR